MNSQLAARVAYGRSIRHRAECLLDAHGPRAVEAALEAASEPGLPAPEITFWQAVADRLARLLAPPRALSLG